MSLFKKKGTARKLSFSPDPSSSSPSSSAALDAAGPHLASPPPSPYEPSLHIDDFGRPVTQPAFAAAAAGGGASPRFGDGYGVGDDLDTAQPAEMQLLYGYTPIATTLELSIVKVDKVVAACADEIRRRGLDTPLIMSSMALDISLDGVCSLIRSYLDDSVDWARDLGLAHPLSVGAFMKWALARLVNERGRRGFLSAAAYEAFRSAERASNYSPTSCTRHLISSLPPSNGRLLTNLLSLFSSIAAHSAANGMPPRKLASLFSPYVFGLADDRSFDETYREWQRATDALEHILLAFIRDQQAQGQLPTFLERYVAGYPDMLNVSYSGAPPKVPAGARIEEVTRVKRVTRFHTVNLIKQGASWDVPHSNDWQLFFSPGASLSASTSSTASTSASSPDRPVYTPSYRHLLNIRSSAAHGLVDDDDEGELQRHKTAVEKDWAKFGEIGFSDVDEKKLEFDLTEGEREAFKRKRDTMDWSTFESAGFQHEMFAPGHLVFHHTLKHQLATWPSSAKVLDQRLRQAEQALPAFPYDTTPREEGRITVDAGFFEAWADVLVGGGWAKDELKESSWALVQWKARPRDGTVPVRAGAGAGGDPRIEERWVLVEEFVPREYRDALLADPKVKLKESRRISFMRAVRRRGSFVKDPSSTSSPTPDAKPVSSSSHFLAAPLSSSQSRREPTLRPIDEAIFDPKNDVETKLMSLSDVHLAPRATGATSRYAPSTSYAPSVVSTARAADGHSSTIFGRDGASVEQPHQSTRASPVPHSGEHDDLGARLGPRLGSPSASASPYGARVAPQQAPAPTGSASPFAAAPVGYSKPDKKEKGGFLKRMNTKKVAEGMNRLWRGPNGTAAPSDRSPPAAAPVLASSAPYPTYGGAGAIGAASSASPVPALAPPAPPAAPQPAAPQLEHGHSYSVPLPGAPLALAPVAARPSGSSPLATAGDDASPYLSPSAGATSSPFDNGYRQSIQSTASGNPYDGLDDTDASVGGTETEADVDGAEVGEVLFRGSRSFPDGLDDVAEGRRPSVTSVDTVQHAQPQPQTRTLSTSARLAPAAQFASPPRHASLPDSPKPDADAPYDPHDSRFPSARYASGTSQLTQRVAGIVGLYEQRDREAVAHGSPPQGGEDVRLTQFGFGEGAAPTRA
ncbi:hypothetical protein JCM3775_005938 [Rhodotorula graminis]|uniref:Rho-GAP domain-containing protein n=1 Tax=Rhodotorula graminis (strain WP1) TaxID=578459 RepID=A0A194SD23_RHOGW|nr:uncharacterized protein RHOBADRAFT_50821 [Rhodotorula graminis WP1]KPV78345.1 hypothetical protein RHOBADRAFT_50821 [Rhodotorula graminis WP1]